MPSCIPRKRGQRSTLKAQKPNSRGLKSLSVARMQKCAKGAPKIDMKKHLAEEKINPTMSEYEVQIQKNIEERKKLFAMLQFDVVKQELLEVLPNQCEKKLKSNDCDPARLEPEQKGGRPPGIQIDKTKAEKGKHVTPPARTSTRKKRKTQFFDYLDYLDVEETLATDRLRTKGLLACKQT